jgi:hypothetical protein
MKKIALLLLSVSLPLLVRAQLVTFETHLSGSQEVPPTPSAATGFGTATLDEGTDLFTFNYSFSGLSSLSTASHIHAPGPVGVSAPVIIPFGLAQGLVLGNTFGSVSFSGVLDPLQASELLAGQFYVNVHSVTFPGGEIRGQIVEVSAVSAVPEPSTYALGGGLLMMLVVARRRFRSKTV